MNKTYIKMGVIITIIASQLSGCRQALDTKIEDTEREQIVIETEVTELGTEITELETEEVEYSEEAKILTYDEFLEATGLNNMPYFTEDDKRGYYKNYNGVISLTGDPNGALDDYKEIIPHNYEIVKEQCEEISTEEQPTDEQHTDEQVANNEQPTQTETQTQTEQTTQIGGVDISNLISGDSNKKYNEEHGGCNPTKPCELTEEELQERRDEFTIIAR